MYRTDEEGAFRLLFDSCRRPLFLFAMRILNDRRAAEDVIQDCFVDFWANDRIKSVSGDIVRYLFGAVNNASHNHIRKTVRMENLHRRTEGDRADFQPEPEHDDPARTERLYGCVARLPAEQQRIFLMIAVDGAKYREAADRLSISINTVKTHMKRALSSLRYCFGRLSAGSA